MNRTRRLLALGLPVGLVRIALLVRLVDEWWSYLPSGALGDLTRDLDIGYGRAGWLLALLWIGGLVGNPVSALADHVARRPIALAGAVGLTAGLLAYAASAPFAGLAGASFVLGMSSDMIIRPIESALAEVETERLDRLLGQQHMLSWLGDFAGPVLLYIGASTTLGWQGAFAITAAAVGAYAISIALTEFPPPPAHRTPARGALGDALRLARRREVLLLAGSDLLLGPLDEPLFGFAVARLVDDGRGGASQVLAVGVLVGGLCGSGLVSRRGLSNRTRRAGAPCLAAGAAVVAVGPTIPIQLAGMGLLAFGMALVWAALHHRMLTVVPGRASTVSALVSALSTPAALVPVIVGYVADATSLTVGLALYAATALPLLVIVPAAVRASTEANSGEEEDGEPTS